jgi:hypothetical protein
MLDAGISIAELKNHKRVKKQNLLSTGKYIVISKTLKWTGLPQAEATEST